MSQHRAAAALASLLLAACSAPPAAPQTHAAPPDADAGEGGQAEEEPLPDPIALEHGHAAEVDHLARARRLREEGDVLGALTEARRAVADDRDGEEALNEVARLSELARKIDLASLAWARLAELEPDAAAPAIRHARLLLELGRAEDAALAGQAAISRDPHDPEGYQVTGRAFLARGDLPGAIAMFQRVLELDPDHGHALNNLGLAYLRANRDEKAVELLSRAADLLPTVAYVHNNLGVALERVGRVEEAKGAYALASSLSPRYIKAQVNRARLSRVASVPPME